MAGGTHHSQPEGGAGFCVFNDMAYATIRMLQEQRAERVLILIAMFIREMGPPIFCEVCPALSPVLCTASRIIRTPKRYRTWMFPSKPGVKILNI